MNEPLPLFHAWERVAAKDLSEITHILVNGVFESPADYARRLRQSAEAIEMIYGGQLDEFDPLPLMDHAHFATGESSTVLEHPPARFAAVLAEGEPN